MKTLNRAASMVITVVTGKAIARRNNLETGEREYLLEWFGAQGERHEQWLPASRVKLED